MFPVTEAIGDDVHWCIAEWVFKGQPWSLRLFILEAVREGVLELKIHSKRQALPERVGFDGGLYTKHFRARFSSSGIKEAFCKTRAANQSVVAPRDSVVR